MSSEVLEKVQGLIRNREVRISEHGYDELSADGLLAHEVVEGVVQAIVVENYPNYPKGPCVLVLQRDKKNRPLHVVWGIPKGQTGPAVLVTAYRPDPRLWENDFLRRRR